jgi:hypothetical protein
VQRFEALPRADIAVLLPLLLG